MSGQTYRVTYDVMTGIDGSTVVGSGDTVVFAHDEQGAVRTAIEWAEEHDPHVDPRIDPRVRVNEVEPLDSL